MKEMLVFFTGDCHKIVSYIFWQRTFSGCWFEDALLWYIRGLL